MIKSRLRRIAKLGRGFFYTYINQRPVYDPNTYWNEEFYKTGVSDSKTLAAADLYDDSITKYHYASIELLIHRMCIEDQYTFKEKSVLDVGAGSGHWVNFYLQNGASHVTAIDLSEKSCQEIKHRFSDKNVKVKNCNALDVDGSFDVVNAIGVMFHIINEDNWAESIKHLEKIANEKMIFGGAFSCFTTNYQWNHRREATKRLRSIFKWRRNLKSPARVIRNSAFAKVSQSLPHSNLLIVSKQPTDEHDTI